MRLTSRIALIVPTVAVMTSLSAPAFAAPTYPPAVPDSITVSSTSAVTGSSITVSAKTFLANSDVQVRTALEASASGDAAAGSSTGGGRLGSGVRAAASGECATGRTCTVVASGLGVATAEVALTEAGSTVITLSGTDPNGAPLSQTVAVEVGADAAAPAPQVAGLASTGPEDLAQVVGVAVAMLTLGAGLVLLVRRRRDSFADAA